VQGRLAGTRLVTTLVGPGVMLAAFALAVALFAPCAALVNRRSVHSQLGSWMPAGSLTIDWALQLDQLSMLMTLVITGVGFLIHVFSTGYMADDAGYARYFAYLNLFVA
jgi:NADH-quinone oxidoreductase subunit L